MLCVCACWQGRLGHLFRMRLFEREMIVSFYSCEMYSCSRCGPGLFSCKEYVPYSTCFILCMCSLGVADLPGLPGCSGCLLFALFATLAGSGIVLRIGHWKFASHPHALFHHRSVTHTQERAHGTRVWMSAWVPYLVFHGLLLLVAYETPFHSPSEQSNTQCSYRIPCPWFTPLCSMQKESLQNEEACVRKGKAGQA
jgi:hypothetical protein